MNSTGAHGGEAMTARQRDTCTRAGSPWAPPATRSIVGVSRDLGRGTMPIHGLRHPPVAETCGWYLWAGELSTDADFFVPLHVEHLAVRCPLVLPYLALAPGWRVLLDDRGHEDVWFDEALLRPGAP